MKKHSAGQIKTWAAGIKDSLDKHLAKRDLRLDLNVKFDRQDEDWLYFDIELLQEPANNFPFYESLAETEIEWGRKNKISAVLIPVFPEDRPRADAQGVPFPRNIHQD